MADATDKISITICGDGGCGKSSITLRLVRSQWIHEYDPTIEDSYSVTRVVDGVPYFLSITDTAGQEEYRGLWAASNLRSDAFLLVYDITNKSSLGALDYFMDMIEIETEQRLEDNDRLRKELGASADGLDVGMPPPVKIVAGNKCDLKDNRVISSREGLEYARKHGCGFMETSAREMVNIEETFALLVRRVVEARRLHYQKGPPTSQAAQRGEPATAAKSPADTVVSKEGKGESQKRTQKRQSGLRGLFGGKRARQDPGEKGHLQPEAIGSGQNKPPKPAKASIWKRMSCC
ncbi:putative RAS small monomeric GTPase [Aspergillus vadensis CBS 113365]|uniref:Ras small monomeric GTPase n=1 Tax=Aspergillus vadensis (strain CBS 113365 / IMI 142717 / IBT 24658) TaxID=1448311 RepID=A0A319AWZ1_ASPVC|nr:ras small monomeric GTPase [Aspergillus vadensis CBS 113365]PYH63891.1 ras small monomeric GTPase [Aspergillus vadensis CBS 113365]